MSYDIGPKIGIEGEKEYREALNQINNRMKTLGTEMSAVTSAFDKNDRSIESLTAQNEVLNKQIDTQKTKLSELRKGLEASRDKYGENDKVTQGWQQSVNKATAELNSMERQLKDNTEEMSDAAKETKGAKAETRELSDSQEKATGTAGKLSAAMGNVASVMAKGVAAAAKATALAVAAVGTAAVAAAKQVIDLTVKAGDYADQLLTTSAQTGVSAKTLQEWDYAARFIDTETETMTKGLGKVTKAMGAAASGNKDYIEVANGVKVAIKGANGELLSSEDVFYSTIDALGKIKNETERDIAAQELFGKSYQDMAPLIQAGSKGLKKYADEAQRMGVILSDEAVGALGTFDDTMEKIDAQTQSLGRNIAITFLPIVSKAMDSAQKVLSGIGAALQNGFQPEDIKAIGGILSKKLIEGVSAISKYIPDVVSTVSDMLTQVVALLVTLLPQLLPPLMDGAIQLLMGVINSIRTNIRIIVDMAVEIVKKFADFMIEALPLLISAALEIVIALAAGITKALPELIPAVVDAILTITKGLIDNLPLLINTAIQLVLALVEGILQALPKIYENVPEIIRTLINGLVDAIPLLFDVAIKIILALIDYLTDPDNLITLTSYMVEIVLAIVTGLIKAIPRLITGVVELISSIKKKFQEIDWGEVGRNMMTGIANGIKNGITNIVSSAKEAAKTALSTLKNLLGIHSPSSVMRDQIGLQIGAGLAQGVDDSRKQLKAAMSGLNDELGVNPTFSGGGSGRFRSAAESGTPINISVEVPVDLDGKTIQNSTSRIQYSSNQKHRRALGVVTP